MTVSSYTPNFKMALIDFNSQNWHGDEWSNWLLVDALLASQFDDIPFGTATGVNTLIATMPGVSSYTAGRIVSFKLVSTPTGNTTLNINSLGAKPLYFVGADIRSGDIVAGDIVRALYDGAAFNILDPVRRFTKVRIASGAGSSGTPLLQFDDITIDSDTDAGISFLGPNSSVLGLVFGRPTTVNGGSLLYYNSTATLILKSDINLNITAPVIRLTGDVTLMGNVTVTGGTFQGNLTGNVTGNVSGTALNVTGVVAVANGGTGVTDVAGIKSLLSLQALAYKGTVNGSDWSGTDLAILDGGTGASSAPVALSNLGGFPANKVVIQAQTGASYAGLPEGGLSFEYS